MGVGDKIAKAIDMKGINAAELSRISGVDQGRISNIISGKTKNPRGETLQKLANALETTVDSLYSESNFGLIPPDDRPGPPPAGLIPPGDHQADDGRQSEKHSPYIDKIVTMLRGMDEETQKDVCLSVEKEKLLRDLLRREAEKQKAG